MRDIIEALAGQIPAFAAMAREIVDSRLKDFETKVLERFASATDARADAFKDPDFQYLLNRAQHAYARSGDSQVGDTLVDLIAQRSLIAGRTRLAMTLNAAVEVSSTLTVNEFAELTLCFLLKYTLHQSVVDFDSLIGYLKSYVAPLLPDISDVDASYQFIESQGCGNVGITQLDVVKPFHINYGGILSRGFDEGELIPHIPDGKMTDAIRSSLLMPCLNDAHKLQIAALNENVMLQRAPQANLSPEQAKTVWNFFTGTFWTKDEMAEKLRPNFPEIDRLFQVWETTPMKRLVLTATGIAIGHANARRIVPSWRGDLSIWIR